MKKKEEVLMQAFQKQSVILRIVFFSIALSSFVLALHDATTSSGGTAFYIVEDTVTLFNITINISDANQSANVSSVTITLPASFTFSAGSQNTSANAAHEFTSTATFLNWTNTSFYLINGSGGNDLRYFWFNATAATPGTYTLVIRTLNGTATFNPRNLTVNVNDTTAPAAFYVFPGNNTATRSSTINISGSFTDNYNLSALTLYVWNSTHVLVNSTIINTSLTSLLNGLANFTYTFPAQDRYYINFRMNDTANNSAFNATNITVVYDATAPAVSLAKSSSTKTSLTLTITATDGGAGMNSSCAVSGRAGASVSGTGSSQTIIESNLSCSTAYTYDVSCTDAAGNTGTASSSFSTDGCGTAGGTGTTGSGGGTTVTWSNTFVTETVAVAQGYTKELAAKERVKVVIAGKDHHVGVLEVTNTTVKVQVTSTLQEVVLAVGESKRFEVTNDSTYDLKVTLLGIINASKANLTIQTIAEPIPANETLASNAGAAAGQQQNATAQNASSTQAAGSATKRTVRVVLVVIIVIVLALLAVLVWKWKRKSSTANMGRSQSCL